VVFADAGGERAQARQQSGAGRVAGRSGARRTGEDRAEPGETSQVRCAVWGVVLEDADLVGEIVDGDEEDFGARGVGGAGGGGGDTPKRSGQDEAADEFPGGRGCGWGALD